MIWTPRQVAAVEGYTFSQAVDEGQLHRVAAEDGSNPLMDYVRDHLFEGLKRAVETLGVMIDRQDIEYRVDPDGVIPVLKVLARWNPKTTEGLLIGGPVGGKRYTLPPELHRRGMVVAVQDHSKPLFDESATVDTVTHTTVFYQYAGWSEIRRLWVYRVVPEK
jgi:hypothetical protein